ncbi:MAG: RNA polymerase sigma factor FliA [Endozoicomonadaceae bacterium]|nr:RNA polymerase sigma factor FliA [Endozoicomonadaceae bacterium]MBE8232970.1 RNA polymerase sigma factor FliA [Endozoicomonadaceae bacterium]
MDSLAHGKSIDTTDQAGNTLVEQYGSLVVRIARHLLSKMPSNIQLGDLVQSGMLGLLEASSKYDHTKGASFETFAGIRIRGAMLDEIRRGDWGPRSVYRNNRLMQEAMHRVEARLCREPKPHEVAEEMGVDLEDYFKLLKDMRGCRLFSLEDMFENEEFRLPQFRKSYLVDQSLISERFNEELVEAIEHLPERERKVLIFYYKNGLNLKDIGNMMNVSESRVSQMHTQATDRLKIILKDWL